MNEDRIKHLEFVQAVIGRMAGNSFLLKGWSVTISAALFALAAKDSNRAFALVALLPTLVFWGLDAYYLRQERLFRKLYDRLRHVPEKDQTKEDSFSMATEAYEKEVATLGCTLLAPTVVALHAPILLALGLVYWLLPAATP